MKKESTNNFSSSPALKSVKKNDSYSNRTKEKCSTLPVVQGLLSNATKENNCTLPPWFSSR